MFFTTATSIVRKRERMKAAEAKLLEHAKAFGGSNAQDCNMELFDTPIPSSILPLKYDVEEDLFIHGVKVEVKGAQEAAKNASQVGDKGFTPSSPLIILPGYMNASLYFYRNLIGLAQKFTTVYSLDLLGWGLSSRPVFNLKDDKVSTAEDFFVESIEHWRKEHQIERMNLAGHSMGGYLGVAYCERYPQHVDRLILLSPVGVPEESEGAKERRLSWSRRMFVGLFDFGTTPCSVLRTLSESRGYGYVSSYVEKRLPAIQDAEERKVLTDYLYFNCVLPGSAEYALNRLLTPFAFAKQPTQHRIPRLKVSHVSFLYGASDWMDLKGGAKVQEHCLERHDSHGPDAAPHVDVYEVNQAGHLLMLDNWEEVNTGVVLSAGVRTEKRAPHPKKLLPRRRSQEEGVSVEAIGEYVPDLVT